MMLTQRKAYKQKKHIYVAIGILGAFFLAVRSLHIIYWILCLKNNITIDYIKYDPEQNHNVRFSVKTNFNDCPLNFEIRHINAIVEFKTKKHEEEAILARFNTSDIQARKFSSLNYEGFLFLEHLDLSSVSEHIYTRKLNFKLKMEVTLRFLLIPFTIPVDKNVYTYNPKSNTMSKKDSFSKYEIFDDVCKGFNTILGEDILKSYSFKEAEYSISDLAAHDNPTNNVNIKKSNIINQFFNIDDQLSSNVNNPLKRSFADYSILRNDVEVNDFEEHMLTKKKKFYELEICFNNSFIDKYIKEVEIVLKNQLFIMKAPFHENFILRELKIGKQESKFVLLIPNLPDKSLIVDAVSCYFVKNRIEMKIQSIQSMFRENIFQRKEILLKFPFSQSLKRIQDPLKYEIKNAKSDPSNLAFYLSGDMTKVQYLLFMLVSPFFQKQKLKCSMSIFNTKAADFNIIMANPMSQFHSFDIEPGKKFVFFDENDIVKGIDLCYIESITVKSAEIFLGKPCKNYMEINITNEEEYLKNIKLCISDEIELVVKDKIMRLNELVPKSNDLSHSTILSNHKVNIEQSGTIKIENEIHTKNKYNPALGAFMASLNFDLGLKCKLNTTSNVTKAIKHQEIDFNFNVQDCNMGIQLGLGIKNSELYWVDCKKLDIFVDVGKIIKDVRYFDSIDIQISINNKEYTLIKLRDFDTDSVPMNTKLPAYKKISDFKQSKPIICATNGILKFLSKDNSFNHCLQFSPTASKSNIPQDSLLFSANIQIDPIDIYDPSFYSYFHLSQSKFTINNHLEGLYLFIDDIISLDCDFINYSRKNENIKNNNGIFLMFKDLLKMYQNYNKSNNKIENDVKMPNICNTKPIIEDSTGLNFKIVEDLNNKKIIAQLAIDIPKQCFQAPYNLKLDLFESYEWRLCDLQNATTDKTSRINFFLFSIKNTTSKGAYRMEFNFEFKKINETNEPILLEFEVDNRIKKKKLLTNKESLSGILKACKNLKKIFIFSSPIKFMKEDLQPYYIPDKLQIGDFLHLEPITQESDGDESSIFFKYHFKLCSDRFYNFFCKNLASVLKSLPLTSLPKTCKFDLLLDLKSDFGAQLVNTKSERVTFILLNEISLKRGQSLDFELEYNENDGYLDEAEVIKNNKKILEGFYGGNTNEIEKYEKKFGKVKINNETLQYPLDFVVKLNLISIEPKKLKMILLNPLLVCQYMKFYVSNPVFSSFFNSIIKPPKKSENLNCNESETKSKNKRFFVEYWATIRKSLYSIDKSVFLKKRTKDMYEIVVSQKSNVVLLLASLPFRINFIKNPLTVCLALKHVFSACFQLFGILNDPDFESNNKSIPRNFCMPIKLCYQKINPCEYEGTTVDQINRQGNLKICNRVFGNDSVSIRFISKLNDTIYCSIFKAEDLAFVDFLGHNLAPYVFWLLPINYIIRGANKGSDILCYLNQIKLDLIKIGSDLYNVFSENLEEEITEVQSSAKEYPEYDFLSVIRDEYNLTGGHSLINGNLTMFGEVQDLI